jgi:hypothetical protein
MKTRLFIAIAVFLGSLTGACTRVLDHEKIEQSIREEGEKKEWPLKKVECPSGRPIKKGDAFDCKVSFDDGQTLVIAVTQSDDIGSVKWRADKVLSVKKISAAIAKQVAPEGVVACPRESVVVARKGDKIECTITTDDVTQTVEVTALDDDGKVSMRVVPPPSPP